MRINGFYAIVLCDGKVQSRIVENAIANYLKMLEIIIDRAIAILKIQVLSMAEE